MTAATRPRRRWLLVSVLAVAVALTAFVSWAVAAAQSRPGSTTVLNSRGTDPAGSKAVAEVLREHHVTVRPTNSLQDTQKQLAAHPDATVLLYDALGSLNPNQVTEIRHRAARLVWVNPSGTDLHHVDPRFSAAGEGTESGPSTVSAGCQNRAARAAGSIKLGGEHGALAPRPYRGPVTCFPLLDGGVLATDAGSSVTALGGAAALTNGAITDSGNAALALHLLGHNQNLIWYTPGVADIPAGGATGENPFSYLPAAFTAVSAWLVVLAAATVLWAVRRKGPVISEPLPVSVKANETTLGRARLYQRGHAVDAAVDNLRSAALSRIAGKLRLPASASAHEVVGALAHHAERQETELAEVLEYPRVRTNRDLVRWANRLEAIESALPESQE